MRGIKSGEQGTWQTPRETEKKNKRGDIENKTFREGSQFQLNSFLIILAQSFKH